MAKGITSGDPSRADHRLIQYLLNTFYKKDRPNHDPEEYDKVTNVFSLMGGSWERLFKGSIEDMSLLRKCLKIAVAKGVISKAPKWR